MRLRFRTLVTVPLLFVVVSGRGVGADPGDDCAQAIVLDAALLPLVELGSTFGGVHDYRGSCAIGNDAPEKVFLFTPETTGSYWFSTDNPGTNFDTVIYVREFCDEDFTEVACADDFGGDTLTFPGEAGMEYSLFVDGFNGGQGDFELRLESAATTAVEPPGGTQRIGLEARPNPFRGITSIHYDLASPATVDLAIFDVQGRRIVQLVSRRLGAGSHAAIWDGRDTAGRPLAGGIYFHRLTVRLEPGDSAFTRSGKLVLER